MLDSAFCWNHFLQKQKSTFLLLIATTIGNLYHTLKLNHDINCYNNYEGNEVEEAYQDDNWGGVFREGKVQRHGREYKGGKMKENEERGGGIYPGFGREE